MYEAHSFYFFLFFSNQEYFQIESQKNSGSELFIELFVFIHKYVLYNTLVYSQKKEATTTTTLPGIHSYSVLFFPHIFLLLLPTRKFTQIKRRTTRIMIIITTNFFTLAYFRHKMFNLN